VSSVFGYDRGNQSVHRYYIDKFISLHREKIKGKVLEVGESLYMDIHKKYVSEGHIIHYAEKTKDNAFVGDLTDKITLPQKTYNCFICTQTFNFIFDFHAAIQGAYSVLQPGGYLIATVSGIQQISQFDETRWGDYWRFTHRACKASFEKVFGAENVEVSTYGNVLSTVAALEGLSSDELKKEELDVLDPAYQLIIGIVAKRK
jgi:hypothetical protein